MRRLLATTAIALLAAGQLSAQSQEAPAEPGTAPTATPEAAGGDTLFVATQAPTDVFSSDLVGMDVYSSATDYEAEFGDDQPVGADVRSAWDDIGTVDDLLLSAEGEVKAVLVDVGGFLGMGAHTVALSMEEIHVLTDETGARFAAITSSREALEAAPEFEPLPEPTATTTDATGAMGTAPATAPAGTMAVGDDAGAATAPTGTMAAGEGAVPSAGGAMAPAEGTMAADADAFVPMGAAEVTAEQLEGATVYSRQDEQIGDISELVMGTDGKITQAVVDVGGFLGMGEHSVALGFEELEVMTHPETGEVRVYIDATKQDLEQLPEYEG
jgi:hypothetical protein